MEEIAIARDRACNVIRNRRRAGARAPGPYVRGTVEETLNAMLERGDRRAMRPLRAARRDQRSGSYDRKLRQGRR